MMYLKLFFEFFKVGLFSIGGGLATIPFLQDLAEKTNWFTKSDIVDMIAISESTPGPIGVNMASGIGFDVAGVFGNIVATLGLITPSIIIILIISYFLKAFKDNRYVKSVFYGLRPASTGLIAAAGFSVITISLINIDRYMNSNNIKDLFNWKCIVLAVIIFLISNNKKLKKIHPIALIALSAVVGIVFNFSVI